MLPTVREFEKDSPHLLREALVEQSASVCDEKCRKHKSSHEVSHNGNDPHSLLYRGNGVAYVAMTKVRDIFPFPRAFQSKRMFLLLGGKLATDNIFVVDN